jgi:hypothetical protein
MEQKEIFVPGNTEEISFHMGNMTPVFQPVIGHCIDRITLSVKIVLFFFARKQTKV